MGEMQLSSFLPALAHGDPESQTAAYSGFHRPTTLSDGYYPWRGRQGIPIWPPMMTTMIRPHFLVFEVEYLARPGQAPHATSHHPPRENWGPPWLTGAGDGAGQASNHPKSEQDKLQDLPWEDVLPFRQGSRAGREIYEGDLDTGSAATWTRNE